MAEIEEDPAWVRRAMQDDVDKLEAEIERLRAALVEIASNTCCDRCQEAALVARQAIALATSPHRIGEG